MSPGSVRFDVDGADSDCWKGKHVVSVKFRTTIELGGRTATGLAVPDEVVAGLGLGSRPAVLVTLGGHRCRTTVARMGGRFLVPLSAENRAAAGVAAGHDVEVDIEADTAPREVSVPADEGPVCAVVGEGRGAARPGRRPGQVVPRRWRGSRRTARRS